MRFSGRLSGHAAPKVIERVDSDELRVVRGPKASAIVTGHCFASRFALEESLRDFVSTGSVKCFNGWPGCYSVAVLQSRGVTLIADPVGQFPLYLSRVGADVVFGSSAAALAAIVHAAPDQVAVLATLTCPEAHGLVGTRSVFDGVQRLPEGHVARLADGRVDVEPCLEFQADSRISFADAAADLRSALTRAVDSRVASARSPTSDLSGGIDSTSLAFLARRKCPRLPVLTYVNNNRPVVDDVDQAVRAVKLDAGLDHHLVAGSDEDLPYQNIDVIDDEPHSSAVATGSTKARLNAAAKLGSDMHLVGEGGDVVLTAPAAYLADLSRQWDVPRLWRHCVGWARMRNRSPLALLARTRTVSRQNLRKAFTDLAGGIERGSPPGEVSWEEDNIGHWTVPRSDWLTGPARRTLAEYVHSHAASLGEADEKPVGDFVTSARLRSQALTQRAVRNAGAQVGIAVHAPYLDTDVVRACLTLSASRRASVSTPKPLLHAALAGLVPEPVLVRPTKGDYTADAYQGLRRAAPVVRGMLENPATADHGLIEPEPIRQVLARAVEGLSTPWGALNRWVAVEVWLRDRSGGAE